MSSNSNHRFRIHPISAYLFSLFVMATIMMTAGSAWTCYLCRTTPDAWKIYLFVVLNFLGYLIICIVNSFWYFGLYRVNDTGISFYAPFRRSIHIQYHDIAYIGIDFGVVSGSRQFWIYFSTEPIPAKYVHKIHGLPLNRKYMRVQYSDKRFEELLCVLPEKQKRALSKAATILRVYDYSEE